MNIAQISRNPKTEVVVEVEGQERDYVVEMRGNRAVLVIKRIPYKEHIKRTFGLG